MSDNPTPKPSGSELSPRVVSLARAIDRLQPGAYVIQLQKAAAPQGWRVEIVAVQPVRVMEIGAKTV